MKNVNTIAWILLAGLGVLALGVILITLLFGLSIWTALLMLLTLDVLLLIWARSKLKKS